MYVYIMISLSFRKCLVAGIKIDQNSRLNKKKLIFGEVWRYSGSLFYDVGFIITQYGGISGQETTAIEKVAVKKRKGSCFGLWREGCHTMQGHVGKYQEGQEAGEQATGGRSLSCDFPGKQGGRASRLTGWFGNFSGLWRVGTVSSCLAQTLW